MSGSHIAGKLAITDGRVAEKADSLARPDDRMAWPAATLLILLMAAGLWWGIIATLRHVFA